MLHALEDILTKGIVEGAQEVIDAEGVDPELRGWNFNSPKLKVKKRNNYLAMYKVASEYCPTGRELFWKDVKRKRGKKASKPLISGSVLHEVHLR